MEWILTFWLLPTLIMGFLGGASGKESACQCRRQKRLGFDPWVGNIPSRRKWQPTPVFLPGKSHGQRSLVGYSPWGCKELDMTQRLSNNDKIWVWNSFTQWLPAIIQQDLYFGCITKYIKKSLLIQMYLAKVFLLLLLLSHFSRVQLCATP